MKVYQIVKKVVSGGGGNIPPGAAVTTDAVTLAARMSLADSNALPADAQAYALHATYAQTNVLPAEAMNTAFAGPGLAESNPAPANAVSGTVFTYAGSQTNVGNGTTNPANVTGQNDGANCSVTTVSLGATTCSVTPKIARASVPNTGTYTLFAWYKTTAGLAGAPGLTLTYTDTGGNPVNITLTQGDFSVNPFTAAITSLHATNDITVLFQVTDAVAGVSPGLILVDAVAIQTAGAF